MGPRASCSGALCPRETGKGGRGESACSNPKELLSSTLHGPSRLSGNHGSDTVVYRQGLKCPPSDLTHNLRNNHLHGVHGSQSTSSLKCPGSNSDRLPTLGDGVMSSEKRQVAGTSKVPPWNEPVSTRCRRTVAPHPQSCAET